MKRILKLLLWPILMVFELLLLIIGLIFATFSPQMASKIVILADKLPNPDWYLSK